jgi:osmotically inducible protein OsmC
LLFHVPFRDPFKNGPQPTRINTTAKVHLGDGPKITLIELSTIGVVPGMDEKTFQKYAEQAKSGCPVSQALSAVDMKLTARLE